MSAVVKKIISIVDTVRDFIAFFFFGLAFIIASKSTRDLFKKSVDIGLKVQLKAYKEVLSDITKGESDEQ